MLYELLGPGCAKLSLYLSKSYPSKLEEAVPDEALGTEAKGMNAVELLIQRIQAIQEDITSDSVTEEEQAFQEAAEAQLASMLAMHRRN